MNNFYLLAAALFVFLVIYPRLFGKKSKHAIRRKSAENIIKKIEEIQHPAQKIAYLRKVNPYAFEELILTLLQRKGFVIARNERYSGDGGIDGRFEHENRLWLIQAKRYSGRIRGEHVKAFADVLNGMQCNGIFVHTGSTPSSVRASVRANVDQRIEIISGDRLLALFDSDQKLQF
ncbi:restriction endonuclease [Enterobacter hormaechei]|uniref:restriction endonuclease n=1 Tax=Enterobacter hormaechei TaxID=158836 RepID=UPI0013D87E4B|nr:restriction endonuclease [Enterobacter hormaechei]EDK1561937.1 restriction endonuclease [Salmonella enterica subsp. enterica serovar Newport]EKK9105966.1 restriction endonuclease [Salmonella enterica]